MVVHAPNHKQVNSTVELYSINGDERIKRKMPAVHLGGVGYSLASVYMHIYIFFLFYLNYYLLINNRTYATL